MASYRKTKNKWRAEIRRKGVYQSGTFYTKAEAREWATQVEREIDTGQLAARSTKTLGDAFKRYSREVSESKKGRRWEQVRLKRLGLDEIAQIRFKDLTPDHLQKWRDRRSQEVAASSVNRERNLISSVITQAREVWGWTDGNPLKPVKRLKEPPARDRLISADEIRRICWALGFDGKRVQGRSHEVAVAFLVALETGMRLGELTGIKRRHIHFDRRYVHLPKTKNGSPRDVPLSKEAERLIRLVPDNGTKLFCVNSETASSLFRRARIRAGINDLTFHDSRHEACTRLASKIDVLALARMLGIKDTRILMVYYNEKASTIAERLDAVTAPTSQPHPETSEDDRQGVSVQENPACK